jgi:ABC-2 type transport system ATP-binding protein
VDAPPSVLEEQGSSLDDVFRRLTLGQEAA